MKLHFFGTCAGTEPRAGRNHASFAVEQDGKIYWFDAGECCARTAYLMGVDLLAVEQIFISHTHMDHIGGLAPLIWHIRKQTKIKKREPVNSKIGLYIPNLETWEGIWKILKNTEGNFECNFEIVPRLVSDGVIFDDGTLRVTARHNHHLTHEPGEEWRSFSFLIEGGGKRLVFSGDVRDFDDLTELIGEGCDAVMMETGHHSVETVSRAAADCGKRIDCLFFFHNGCDALSSPDDVGLRAQSFFPGRVHVCTDATSVCLL